MKPSTSTTGAWKCCAGTPSSVSQSALCQGFRYAPQDDIPPRVRYSARMLLGRSTDGLSICEFPGRDSARFSSRLRITVKYEMPAIRSQVLASAMRTQRHSRGSLLLSRSERGSSANGLLTRTRSSTSLSSRNPHPRYQWHTTWRLEGVRIR